MARILTAAVLIPLVILLLLRGPFWLLAAAAAAVALLACWEYLALAYAGGLTPPRILVLMAVATLFTTTYFRQDMLLPMLAACALALFLAVTFRGPLDRVLLDSAVAVFAVIYTGLSLATVLLLSELDDGRALLLFLFLAVWSGDIAALYVGRRYGRRRLAPEISPNKTWEGSAASVLGSVLIAGALLGLAALLQGRGVMLLVYNGPVWLWLGLAALLNVAAQLGDLVESALKRGAGVKDSGTLLPGHGGVLDRIDALLLAAPVLWFAVLIQQAF